jgi:hypothetical protein
MDPETTVKGSKELGLLLTQKPLMVRLPSLEGVSQKGVGKEM